MSKKVILTGLRTNAGYHLGNYLGAILPMVRLQREHLGEYQINMFAPDLHSFTTEIEYGKLYQQTMDNLKVFVAAGMPIEHPDFYMYRQSHIAAHSELTWILTCFVGVGHLERMTQYKEKASLISKRNANQYNEVFAGKVFDHDEMKRLQRPILEEAANSISAGLLIYPVLMAADILLYGATYVPVGDDQRQHLELTRDIAIRMNNKFGDLFTVPEAWSKQLEFSHRLEGARIRSLRNPEKKMSKSVDDPSGTILLTDSPEEAEKKVMRAETDTIGSIHWDWDKQPGITNLLQIYELLSGKTHEEVLDEWAGKERYGDLKKVVAEHVSVFLHEFQMNLESVNESELQKKLDESEKKMTETAQQTLRKVQKAVGLRP
jgi:tryptophanyl-tRNA synthetase